MHADRQDGQPPAISAACFYYRGFSLYYLFHHDALAHLTFSATAARNAKNALAMAFPETAPAEQVSTELERQLRDLIDGKLQKVATPIDRFFLAKGTVFQQVVWQSIKAVPFGSTATYGQLAAAAGYPSAARAVGQACRNNPLALIIPCHRIVGAKGIGGFNGGATSKKRLLELERRGLATNRAPDRTAAKKSRL